MSVVEVDKKGFGNVTLCAYRPASEPLKSGDRPPQSHPQQLQQQQQQQQQRSAVEVRRVKLSYGRGKNAKPILTEINLNVPEGAM
jgi:ABC-type transport system involved in cytochrome bd biosynthesis fused ATPase/permease subunit